MWVAHVHWCRTDVQHSRPSFLAAADDTVQPITVHKITVQLATELKVRPAQIEAAVSLLDGGATVPFIARYRKEATGGLDDIQLRELEYRLGYLRELTGLLHQRGESLAALEAME